MLSTTHATWMLSLVFTVVAAGCDWRTGHIPNRLTLGGILAGGALQVALWWLQPPLGDPARAPSLLLVLAYVGAGILACGLVPYLLFLRGGMGGGDVKLLAGVGAFVGPVHGLEVQLYAYVVMAMYACMRLAYDGRLLRVLGHSAALVINPILPKTRQRPVSADLFATMKFGPAVFVGMLVTALMRWSAIP